MNNFMKFYLLLRALPKSLYFNFKYFGLRQAVKLPILVSHNVFLLCAKGTIFIDTPDIKCGMIKIGFGEIGIFDRSRSRSIWQVSGKVIFEGQSAFGHGSKISVEKEGVLKLGKNFRISAESSILCRKEVVFGNNCLVSWECLIMDSDSHKIKSVDGTIVNEDRPIWVGDNVWIGCRCLILKGSKIAKDNVIAANSTIAGSISNSNQVIGGNPSRVLKREILWEA